MRDAQQSGGRRVAWSPSRRAATGRRRYQWLVKLDRLQLLRRHITECPGCKAWTTKRSGTSIEESGVEVCQTKIGHNGSHRRRRFAVHAPGSHAGWYEHDVGRLYVAVDNPEVMSAVSAGYLARKGENLFARKRCAGASDTGTEGFTVEELHGKEVICVGAAFLSSEY